MSTTKEVAVKEPFEKLLKGKTKEWFDAAPKVGIFEIRFKNPKKAGSVTIRSYIDPISKQEITLIDNQGNPAIVRMVKKRVGDLAIPSERLEYVVAKNHPRYVSGAEACLNVICLEEQANEQVSKHEIGIEASEIIRKMAGEDLRNFARVVFLHPTINNRRVKIGPSVTDNVIKKHLYDIVDDNPKLILEEYKDERRPFREVLRAALEKGVILEKSGVYSFGNERIGISFDQAVEWFTKNMDILENIQKQIKTK